MRNLKICKQRKVYYRHVRLVQFVIYTVYSNAVVAIHLNPLRKKPWYAAGRKAKISSTARFQNVYKTLLNSPSTLDRGLTYKENHQTQQKSFQ